ncbi:MAG: DNA repair protein RecO, partial [Deltaproteobacteria bacterium]|nr:DNA repair protein RecO [Deltaproteobacteria bacterium]
MSETLVDEALVLDRVPYGDHDLVTALLTRNNGRASLFARGARRRRPRFGAALDLHCLVEAEWRPPRAGTLGVLVRADLLDDHRTLRGDLDGLLLASFAAEAIKETCPEGEPVPSVFALQAALLARLCRSPTEPAAAPTRTWPSLWIAFQIKLLGLLGYAP